MIVEERLGIWDEGTDSITPCNVWKQYSFHWEIYQSSNVEILRLDDIQHMGGKYSYMYLFHLSLKQMDLRAVPLG